MKKIIFAIIFFVLGAVIITYAGSPSVDSKFTACESIPNGKTLEIKETSRVFINLPEDIYPFVNRQFFFNGATAGLVSNGEGLGPRNAENLDSWNNNNCTTHYYEFEGNGLVDMKAKSSKPGFPDYEVHFKVKSLE